MRKTDWPWLRLLFGGAILFGATGADCTVDALYELSDLLDGWADDLSGEDDDDWWNNVVDEIEDWF